MPFIEHSSYRPPHGLSNGHLQTVLAQLRTVRGVLYRRERIATPDGDFLDLDWAEAGGKKLSILSHGLEGNTQRPYVLGMVKALQRRGWDALAWNYRGCSGEPNRKLRSYHSGETGDLHTVIQHALSQGRHSEFALIGFSLGGNITLKYLGEQGSGLHAAIVRAAAFSVPCDLESGAIKLAQPVAKLYMLRFLRSLRQKVRDKKRMFPDQIDDAGFDNIRTFMEFDNRYTAPIHGFKDAHDYFTRCSSRQFLPAIRIPTLLVNSKNDPFLAEPSFPYEEARASKDLFFEAPASGGHTGFITFDRNGEYWSETRALSFLEESCNH